MAFGGSDIFTTLEDTLISLAILCLTSRDIAP